MDEMACSQNHMTEAANKRAELHLQISLLIEDEITQPLTLVDAVAHHLGVQKGAERQVEKSEAAIQQVAQPDTIPLRFTARVSSIVSALPAA